ncbi:hypothetical protein UlMin_035141 [Ulmus minor]
MAEAQADRTQTLAEQYLLKEKEEKPVVDAKPAEVKEADNSGNTASEDVVLEKVEETPTPTAKETTEAIAAVVEETSESTPSAGGESTEVTPAAADNDSEAATEESAENTENPSEQEAAEETPEIKLETAPADFRFPTTNQTRHCFTRYVEFHRCVAAKGDDAPECEKFAKYYRALCPGEWVDRWNEQRENGTFPGPL